MESVPITKKLPYAQRFEDLVVFRRAYKISLEIHSRCASFPATEQFSGMADQMRRASKSICANLAEGVGKHTSKAETKKFVRVALGSCEEMRLWCRYCVDLKLVVEETWQKWRDEYEEISRMLYALMQNVQRTAG